MTFPSLHMLDTNIASVIIKGNVPFILARLTALSMNRVVVSSVPEAELLYGLAKCGRPAGLAARIREFLARVDVLPWYRKAAAAYGDLRISFETVGISLEGLDMMIAAHAVSVGATLVTKDQAFSRVPSGLNIEDWTKESSPWSAKEVAPKVTPPRFV